MWESDCNAHGNGYAYCNSYCNSDSYGNGYSNTYGNSNRYRNGSPTKGYTDAKTASYTAPATIA